MHYAVCTPALKFLTVKMKSGICLLQWRYWQRNAFLTSDVEKKKYLNKKRVSRYLNSIKKHFFLNKKNSMAMNYYSLIKIKINYSYLVLSWWSKETAILELDLSLKLTLASSPIRSFVIMKGNLYILIITLALG